MLVNALLNQPRGAITSPPGGAKELHRGVEGDLG